MHLQNIMMQLHKVCLHHFLFDWPLDLWMQQPIVDKQLTNTSGKVMVLKRLLEALFERGHKVLVFLQFVTMLNVIEVSVPTLSSCHLLMDNSRLFQHPCLVLPRSGLVQSGSSPISVRESNQSSPGLD